VKIEAVKKNNNTGRNAKKVILPLVWRIDGLGQVSVIFLFLETVSLHLGDPVLNQHPTHMGAPVIFLDVFISLSRVICIEL